MITLCNRRYLGLFRSLALLGRPVIFPSGTLFTDNVSEAYGICCVVSIALPSHPGLIA